jgi:hypothetical protein
MQITRPVGHLTPADEKTYVLSGDVYVPSLKYRHAAEIDALLEQAARLWFADHPEEHRGARPTATHRNLFLYAADQAYWDHLPAAPDPAPQVEHVVYRAYDAAGALIYVGMSSNLKSRLRAHRRGSDWWRFHAEIATEVFPTRAAALAAEEEAIRTENPIWNLSGVRGAV